MRKLYTWLVATDDPLLWAILLLAATSAAVGIWLARREKAGQEGP